MHIVVDEYARGGRGAYEIGNDGRVIAEWVGPVYPLWERTDAFVTVFGDDTDEAVDRVSATLSWLREEIIRRKGSPAALNGTGADAGAAAPADCR